MNRAIDFTPAARRDVVEAAAWYSGKEPDLDDRLIDDLEAAIDKAAANPQSYTPVRRARGIRKITLHRFPYIVLFEVSASSILVVAVFHQRRDPRLWRTRLRKRR